MDNRNRSILSVMEMLEADEEYQALEQRRLEKMGGFRAVLETLSPEQKDAVIDYIGICEEQHWRGMEVVEGSLTKN